METYKGNNADGGEKSDDRDEEPEGQHPALEVADEMMLSERNSSAKENSGTRKKLVAFLVVFLLLAAGGYFMLSGDDADAPAEDAAANENSSEDSTDADAASQTTIATKFDQIVYAHAGTEVQARDIFSRPVSGGDRTDTDESFGVSSFVSFDRDGDSYVVATDDGSVYFGTGASAPSVIYTATNGVSDMLLDATNNSLLVLEREFAADFVSVDDTVTEVDTTSGSTSVFLTENADIGQVLFLEDWNSSTKTLIGRRSCTQCDGYDPTLIAITADGTETTVHSPDPGQDLGFETGSGYSFNNDGSMALYITNTSWGESNPHGIASGLNGPSGAPFSLYLLDTSSGAASEVLTFGEGGDVPSDGFFDSPVVAWADFPGTQQMAYSYLSKVFVENESGNFDNYFEAGQGSISSIYRVDQDEVVIGAGIDGGEAISYFNIDTQKGALVMETLFTTTILAITAK